MKIFCIDTFSDGHHISYLKGLCASSEDEYVFAIPEFVSELPVAYRQNIVPYDLKKRGPIYDLKWLWKVYKFVKEEKPDIVHFLYGDLWYRYFGLGLGWFKQYRSVITFHVVPNDIKHRVSVKWISNCLDKCVVHTEKLYNQIREWGVRNASHVEYPCFFPVLDVSQHDVRNELSIPQEVKVFACLGGTRKYKGLDFVLEALKAVKGDFHLLIAGAPEYFTREMIENNIVGYKDKVTLILHQLSDEEFMRALIAADWILLPYRKAFTGASGPLAEGVMCGKHIIGPQSGSIGDIVSRYELGKTFESENVEALAAVIENAITDQVFPSEKYKSYQRSLSPKAFTQKYKCVYNEQLFEE